MQFYVKTRNRKISSIRVRCNKNVVLLSEGQNVSVFVEENVNWKFSKGSNACKYYIELLAGINVIMVDIFLCYSHISLSVICTSIKLLFVNCQFLNKNMFYNYYKRWVHVYLWLLLKTFNRLLDPGPMAHIQNENIWTCDPYLNLLFF